MPLTNVDLFRIDGTIGSVSNISTAALNGGPLAGARNRIINGDMRIDQRNAGAAVTMSNPGTYDVDRWYCTNASDGAMTAQQISDAPVGFVNSIRCTTTTADASLGTSQRAVVAQMIEGFNVADLGWGAAGAVSVTLSFWVKSSLTGTFGGALRNSAADRSYPFTYSINSANTWEQKSITISGDTTGTWLKDNGVGVSVNFGLGVASNLSGTAGAWAAANNLSATGAVSVLGTLNATWQVTGVQLEAGTVATPFERRSYGQELALCQRYYEQWQGLSNYSPVGTGLATATNSVTFPLIYKVQKRTSSPSLIVSSAAALSSSNGSGTVTVSNSLQITGGATQVNDQSMMISAGVATTPFTVGQASLVYLTNSSSAYIAVSSEL